MSGRKKLDMILENKVKQPLKNIDSKKMIRMIKLIIHVDIDFEGQILTPLENMSSCLFTKI